MGMHLAFLLLSLCAVASLAEEFSRSHLIQPVPLQDVQLKAGSQFDKAVSLNKEYLLGLDSDRLLKTFRINAGLDAPGAPFAGSWEDPTCEVRGQYLGHWLSGTAVLGKNSGDKAILKKADHIVTELRKVQEALGGGYLSAFPTEHFERLRSLHSVWAPFYVIHKIMAGLLDQYLFLGNNLALQMVIDEAAYFKGYIEDVLEHEGKAHWIQMLETEYGGLEELLFNLYDVTGNKTWAKMATYFTKPNFFLPLTKAVDTLPGRHANTHLAQVNGFAAGFEMMGDRARLEATANFFDIVTALHSYATGGSNANEFWQLAKELGPTIGPDGSGRDTEETCTTYNMMKIARYLFRWSGNPRFADYYEKAVLNGMIGTQRMPADYTPGELLGHSHNHEHSHSDQSLPESSTPRKLVEASKNPHAGMESTIRLPLNQPVTTGERSSGSNSNTSGHEGVMRGWHEGLNWRALAFQMFSGNDLPESSNAPGPGVIIYLMPLGAGNDKDDSWHHWSTPLDSFWCCSGSTSEQFGKLMDSIYFERENSSSPPELFINQYTSSSLHWELGNLDVTIDASFYEPDNVARAIITIEPFAEPSDAEMSQQDDKAKQVQIKLRVPEWVKQGAARVTMDDKLLANNLQPQSYLTVKGSFTSGKSIKVELPMRFETEAIQDWRAEYKQLQAIKMGPFVMAAVTDYQRTIQADPAKIESFIENVSTTGLFSLTGSNGTFLHQGSGLRVSMKQQSACLPSMDCTFRFLEKSSSNGELKVVAAEKLLEGVDVVMESMSHPGHYLRASPSGELFMSAQMLSSPQAWRLEPSSSGAGKVSLRSSFSDGSLSADISGRLAASLGQYSEELEIREPLGQYPDGARLLKGRDRSYVIAPIGNLIEEKYSPYLQFDDSSPTSVA